MPLMYRISDEARITCYLETGVALKASLSNNTPKIAKTFWNSWLVHKIESPSLVVSLTIHSTYFHPGV